MSALFSEPVVEKRRVDSLTVARVRSYADSAR